MRILFLSLLLLTLLIAGSCGSATSIQTQAGHPSVPSLAGLPADGVQPWEKLDSRGYVIPPAGSRGTSALSPDSYFQTGAERFSDGGNVTSSGDALTVSASAGTMSYAIYRFPMGGVQPSAYAMDVNLHPGGSDAAQFWVATSDYGKGTWVWYGPFDDGQITKVVVAGSSNLSGTGTFYTAVVVEGDVSLDIVGVTVSPSDPANTVAPPAPSVPTVTPVADGLELSWSDVIAADLAGYQLYWSYSPFTTTSDNGVNKYPWLENTTRLLLPDTLNRDIYLALSAVDTDGNESGLSAIGGPFKSKNGALLTLGVTTPEVSLLRGDPLQITASGADLYDFDTDGDGVFDITDSASATASIDTSATGIIRPRVRAHSSDGVAVAFGSVSLIVSGNQRPAVSLTASPSFGAAPLNVSFTSDAEDLDGTITEYAWDFDGDGIYDQVGGAGSTNRAYNTPGLYNAKLRATDDQGAWDVDTVAVQATSGSSGAWRSATPAPESGGIGGYSDLKLVGGRPAIAYQFLDPSLFTGPLKYVRASDATGSSWGVPVVIDATNSSQPSLAIIAGNPAVVYYNIVNKDLMYARANDPDGATWGAPVILDGAGTDVGEFPTLLDVGGNPAVAYKDEDNDNLKYIRANTADGSAWGVPQVVDPDVDMVGDGASMAIIAGNPAVSYWNTTTGQLMYVRATHPTGLIWGLPAAVANIPGATNFYQTDLAEHNSLPIVGFRDDVESAVVIARSITLDGSSWIAQYIDYGQYVGAMVDVEIIDNQVVVAYMRAIGEIVFRRAATQDASAWMLPEPVGGYSFVSDMSLENINGKPAITFGRLVLETFTYSLSYWRQQ